MPAKPIAVPGMKPFGLAMNLLRSSKRPGAALGLHGSREVEAAGLRPASRRRRHRGSDRRDSGRPSEGVAGAALLGGGGALLDRGGLEQLFDRLGRRGGSAAFLAVAGVLLHGDLEARLFRHLGQNSALAVKLVTSRRRQVPSTAPRILFSSKESISGQAPHRKKDRAAKAAARTSLEEFNVP